MPARLGFLCFSIKRRDGCLSTRGCGTRCFCTKRLSSCTPLARDPARRWQTIRHAAGKRSATPLANDPPRRSQTIRHAAPDRNPTKIDENQRKSAKIKSSEIVPNHPQWLPMLKKPPETVKKRPKTSENKIFRTIFFGYARP